MSDAATGWRASTIHVSGAIAVLAVLFAVLAYASSFDKAAVTKAEAAHARIAAWCHANDIGPDSAAYQACREAE